MRRDDPVRDGFGATSPGTRMVPCWLVWRLYKPKSETRQKQKKEQEKWQRESEKRETDVQKQWEVEIKDEKQTKVYNKQKQYTGEKQRKTY